VSTVLDPDQHALLHSARRATLATIAPDGRPRLVPCCFALVEGASGTTLYSPIDDKPKRSTDALQLARIQDIQRDARVTVLVDEWDEDWRRLAWVRIEAYADLVSPATHAAEHAAATAALRARYLQYVGHDLEARPCIRLTPTRVTHWAAAGPR